MARSSDERDPVERLAEEFLQRHRRGEHPPVTEYVDRHPECADEIRALFPALVMMERIKPARADLTGSFVGDARSQPGQAPERLGDFRILREVGRGGMGIVYEAEQESLGRHVALKVLPSHALLNPRHLQRFLREARSAARLHHTNIVPVFGVGEGAGLHYYVMQFIASSGLHEVIDELKHLKTSGRQSVEVDARLASTRGVHELARSLLTGQFAAPRIDGTTDAGAPDAQPVAGPPGPTSPRLDSGSAILSGSGRSFAQAVARLGLQVAQALAYAHQQGVLHRDIKPSNLLLDVQGTVWVTDFGLAKALADTDGLTQEGDVLGTLRYMAPERLRGQADARSDVYALGLTLYELLTLRPAFDQEDRDRLIHQVTTGVPPRPRALNAAIPRDLETIVLKAIEHEPARRYQDAEELAADLGRFLVDRPIRARPVGALERAWKWAQRKPAIAALLAALALAVFVGFGGITWQWLQAVAARNAALVNAARAQTNFAHALETVNTFCTQVSEEQLLDEPGMQPLRRRLLELARRYYQRFQREQGDAPSLMRELAQSFMRSGIIAGELGDAAEAQTALFRSQDILAELCRVEPTDVALRVELARCHIEIADAIFVGTNQTLGNNIEKNHDQSLAFMEELVAADPGNPENLRLLGRSYGMSGMRKLRFAQDSAAEASLKKAVATLEGLCRAAPEDVEGARWLALAYADLGLVHQQTGHHADRVRALGRALALLEVLEDRFPKSRRHRLDRAQCLVQVGVARVDLGWYHEAATFLRAAEDRLSRLSVENPDAVDVRYWLAVAKQGMGRVALARGQTIAEKLLGDAIAIHEHARARPLAERDWLELAWSYVWLAHEKLDSGRPGDILPLHRRLVQVLKAREEQLLTGITLPYQARELARIEGLMGPLLDFARATTAPERIAARRREVQVWESLTGRQPDNPSLRFDVAWSRVRLAEMLEQDSRLVEAGSFIDRALLVLQDLAKSEPENLRWRQGLARAREALGRVQARCARSAEARDVAGQAVTIAEELARIEPAYLYDLACTLSLRGRVSTSEADAAGAISALRRAIAAGFDNDYQLRTDPRLDALRSRSDFPALIGKPK
jgi:serine/threonine-protein kinase